MTQGPEQPSSWGQDRASIGRRPSHGGGATARSQGLTAASLSEILGCSLSGKFLGTLMRRVWKDFDNQSWEERSPHQSLGQETAGRQGAVLTCLSSALVPISPPLTQTREKPEGTGVQAVTCAGASGAQRRPGNRCRGQQEASAPALEPRSSLAPLLFLPWHCPHGSPRLLPRTSSLSSGPPRNATRAPLCFRFYLCVNKCGLRAWPGSRLGWHTLMWCIHLLSQQPSESKPQYQEVISRGVSF